MKETKFIEQNKEKWLKFEQLLRLNKRDPDKLSDLFIQITDDLSYARTNYPNRSIRVYLNNVAQQLFYNIYKNKKESRNKFIRFWKDELPSVVYDCRRELLLALIVFVVSATIGVISSVHDPEFARTILGDSYVDETIKNIEAGDPMGVYKKMNEVDMFLGITLNNVLIAFRTFITGIFFSLGAVIILIYNGIMVGTFQYFFIERDLAMTSSLTIWLHGTLEISSIIIAGGAGIVLGKGFVFPGTHSRLRAFQLSARKGLKLLIGIVPILVFAALIESFLTRYTELPAGIKLGLIIASLAFMLLYFVWYPYTKYRNGTLIDLQERPMQSRNTGIPVFEGVIKKVNEIFRDALLVYGKSFKTYFRPIFFISIAYVACLGYALRYPITSGLVYVDSWVFKKMAFIIDYSAFPILFFVNSAFLASIIYFGLRSVAPTFHLDKKNWLRYLSCSLICAVLMNIPFFLNGILSFLLWLAIMPWVLFSAFIFMKESENYLSAMGRFRTLAASSFGRVAGLLSLLLFIGFIFFFLIDSPFFAFYMDFIQVNFVLEQDTTYYLGLILNGVVVAVGAALVIPLFLYSFSIQYFTLQEIKEAHWLKQQITIFGKKGEH